MGYNKVHDDQISPVPLAGPPGTRVPLWAQFRGGGQHPQNHTGSAGGGHTRPTSTPRPPPPWEGLILAGRSIRRPASLWEPRKGHEALGGVELEASLSRKLCVDLASRGHVCSRGPRSAGARPRGQPALCAQGWPWPERSATTEMLCIYAAQYCGC